MRSGGFRIVYSVVAVLVGALALGCASGPPAADADPRLPWNQERVTGLAQELNASATALRRAALNDPALRSAQRAQARGPAQAYLDSLRDLERATGQLARQLEGGQGFEDTLPAARRVGMLLRDAQVSSRRLNVSENQWQVIDPALEIIQQLSPYYSSEWPLLAPTRR